MTVILSDRCRRGHLFNEKNTQVRVQRGFTFRACRECTAMQKRLRYRNNAEYREQKKTRERQRYYDNKGIEAAE